jgi:hypothetical protein
MSITTHEERAAIARRAYEDLGASPSQSMVLQVQCSSAHHVAAVYNTGEGLVFHSVLHAKAHGRRDYVDVGHHASRLGLDWFDLLQPGADPTISDDLAAGCECGPYTLSRSQLIEQVGQGLTRVNVG